MKGIEISGGLFLVWMFSFLAGCEAQLPIVMWHGLTSNRDGPAPIVSVIQQEFPGIYIKSIGVGDNAEDDVFKTFKLPASVQVAKGCDLIRQDPKLANGYNAIGFSLGGLLLRGVAQTCPSPRMNNLLTLGSPHQGVYGEWVCDSYASCQLIWNITSDQAYTRTEHGMYFVAQFWHDPTHEQVYRRSKRFMADLNNEFVINDVYKRNLRNLTNFVMVRFTEDTVVKPPESTWFGFYMEGSTVLTETLFESRLYREDRLGLQRMEREGKLKLLTANGRHLVFTDAWFNDVIMPYLRPTPRDATITNQINPDKSNHQYPDKPRQKLPSPKRWYNPQPGIPREKLPSPPR